MPKTAPKVQPDPDGAHAPISSVAKLLGMHPERLRQLQRAGYIDRAARRGFVSVISAVSGYIRFLKEDSATSTAPSAAARSHAAKAALTSAATARRRANLTEQKEAAEVIETIASAAARRLRAVRLASGLPPAASATFKVELAASVARINTARTVALAAIRTGDFSEIDGHGR
jgi:type IV secretory pathway TrbL component